MRFFLLALVEEEALLLDGKGCVLGEMAQDSSVAGDEAVLVAIAGERHPRSRRCCQLLGPKVGLRHDGRNLMMRLAEAGIFPPRLPNYAKLFAKHAAFSTS